MIDGPLFQVICDGCSASSDTYSGCEEAAYHASLIQQGWALEAEGSDEDLCPDCSGKG